MVMLKPDSFKWDLKTHEWHFAKEEQGIRYWVNPYRDIQYQRLILVPPNDLPTEYPDVQVQHSLFENMVKPNGGAVVNVDIAKVQGVEYFQTLLKYRNPENQLAIRYVGTLMFPFENSFCGFHFQCDEHGTTGMRENMALILFRSQYPDDWEERWYGSKPSQNAPIVLNSMDEYFAQLKSSPLRPLPSDNEEYDAVIPEHPLSRIRRYMKQNLESFEFAPEVKRLKPYRPKPKNKFFDNWGKLKS